MKGHLGTGLVQAKAYARQREGAVVVGAIPGICGSATTVAMTGPFQDGRFVFMIPGS